MRLVLSFLVAAMLATGWSQSGLAQDAGVSAGDRAEVRSVIQQQMDAFHREDAAGAFAFAAPGIQQQFGSPEHFMAVVRHAYQPVYAPRSVDFTDISINDGSVMQSVELIGPDGLAYTALYTMEHETDGSWRIAACVLVESRRLGA